MKRLLLRVAAVLIAAGCGNGSGMKAAGGGNGNGPDRGRNPASPCGDNMEFMRVGFCAQMRWVAFPTETTPGTFMLIFRQHNFLADPPGSILVLADMDGMHHPSPNMPVTRMGTGSYKVERVTLAMRGNWIFNVQLVNRGSIADQARTVFKF